MTTPKEQDKPRASADYERAEQRINQAKMDNRAHIEYGSTMKRNPPPSKFRQWLRRLINWH